MKSVTLRNVPNALAASVRALAASERRSINSEFLVLLEEGLASHCGKGRDAGASAAMEMTKDRQLAVWEALCGAWVDDRDTDELVTDIMDRRTLGREVRL